jgi:phosphatidylserine/phosphatidylglycerophosphate/cardiolipin synthase-like enzyme
LELALGDLFLMDIEDTQDSFLQLSPAASVLSLSLHRLQRAPRAIHRAFLSRPSLFRILRNVKGVFQADRLSFLLDQAQIEACLIRMISRAERSILIVGTSTDPVLQSALATSRREKPQIKISLTSEEFVERIVVVDDVAAILGSVNLALAIEGEIARGVSNLFQFTFHNTLEHRSESVRWPLGTRFDLESIEVGLSRTWALKDQSPVIEIERLLINAIRSARRFIYIEAANLTSPVIVNALSARLKSESGPEVVVILPAFKTSMTLREKSLARVQTAALARILKFDVNGRFRAYESPGSHAGSGLLIVDDQFVKIGGSQLTSRSLGAVCTLDLSVEAVGRPHVVMTIARLRRERLGALLAIDPSEFDARFLLNGSLIDTLESFFTSCRSLVELNPEPTRLQQLLFYASPWIDPKKPRSVARWMTKKLRFAPKIWRYAFILVIMFALLITFSSVFAPFRH